MCINATAERLEEITRAQDKDAVCKQVKEYCQGIWPDKSHLKGPMKAFAKVKQELSVNNDSSEVTDWSSLPYFNLTYLRNCIQVTKVLQNVAKEQSNQCGGQVYDSRLKTKSQNVLFAVSTGSNLQNLSYHHSFQNTQGKN